IMWFCFFFSSRRRHTRWPRDWSSDVCSSDLLAHRHFRLRRVLGTGSVWVSECVITYDGAPSISVSIMEFGDGLVAHETQYFADRSEERRVGKECSAREGQGP